MDTEPRVAPLRQPAFLAALAIAVVVALGFGLIVPVLPLLARHFGVGLFQVTLVVSVFATVRMLSNIYTGALSDRFGARAAVAWGAVVVGVTSLLIAAAPGYWWLVAFRGLGGFGSALFINSLLGLVVRTMPADVRGQAVGMLQGAFLLGISFGPVVGGLLAEPLGLRWPFVIYAGFCAASGVVGWVFLPQIGKGNGHIESAEGAEGEPVLVGEDRRERGFAATWTAARELCRDPAFVAALVMMAASRWAATGVRFSLVPVFGEEEIGASVLVVGVALTLAALTHLVLLWPSGRLIDRAGRRVLGAPAYFLYAVIVAALAFAETIPAFLVVMAFYGIGTGLTSVAPPAIVGDITPPDRAGLGVGVLNTAGDLGSVIGPLASGFLADVAGYDWGFGTAAAALFVAALFALRMRETHPAITPR